MKYRLIARTDKELVQRMIRALSVRPSPEISAEELAGLRERLEAPTDAEVEDMARSLIGMPDCDACAEARKRLHCVAVRGRAVGRWLRYMLAAAAPSRYPDANWPRPPSIRAPKEVHQSMDKEDDNGGQ